MNRGIAFLVLMLSCYIFAQADVTPPTVSDFSFSPTSVDVTTGPAVTDITITASDVGDGLDYADVGIISPSGRDTATTTIHFGGTTGPETVTDAITILGHLESGDWRVGWVIIFDVSGNNQSYSSDVITDLLTVINTGEDDVTPPVLEGFSISPTSVNVTTSSATINISIEASDDLAGLDYASFHFLSPSGSHGVYEIVSFTPGSISETIPIVVTISTDVEWGTWTLNSVYVRDVVENDYIYLTSELTTMSSVSTTFEVINDSYIDVTAPWLTDFYYSPTIVDISTAPGSVDIHIAAEDDLSELNDVYLMLLSPNYNDSIWTEADFIPTGTHTGNVIVNMTIPMDVETGSWRIQMSISEEAGNRHYYDEVSIAAIPLPAILTVISTDEISQVNNIPSSYELYQNYPNPFNPTTNIIFGLPEESDVRLTIYDINGRLIENLIGNRFETGYHTVQWDAENVPSGLYIYQIQTESYIKTRKMLVIK